MNANYIEKHKPLFIYERESRALATQAGIQGVKVADLMRECIAKIVPADILTKVDKALAAEELASRTDENGFVSPF
jgi:hypothetical protein